MLALGGVGYSESEPPCMSVYTVSLSVYAHMWMGTAAGVYHNWENRGTFSLRRTVPYCLSLSVIGVFVQCMSKNKGDGVREGGHTSSF